jgi:hypothetical protein
LNPEGHCVQEIAALGNVENRSALQFEHTPAPVTFLNVPPTQAGHGPPFGPLYPILHVQFVTIVF